jgi:ABC-type dipeptide/oligopeptide/nickel transport system permease subunit
MRSNDLRDRALVISTIAQALQIPGFILYEAFLSFIGLGAEPGYTDWG